MCAYFQHCKSRTEHLARHNTHKIPKYAGLFLYIHGNPFLFYSSFFFTFLSVCCQAVYLTVQDDYNKTAESIADYHFTEYKPCLATEIKPTKTLKLPVQKSIVVFWKLSLYKNVLQDMY